MREYLITTLRYPNRILAWLARGSKLWDLFAEVRSHRVRAPDPEIAKQVAKHEAETRRRRRPF